MQIFYVPVAVEQLSALPRNAQARIKKKLDFYARQKEPLHFAKRLVGYEAYRFRIGEYRVIFTIEKKTLYVLMIVKRDDAYKDL